ncbi:MAG: hypothetical protein MI755_03775 [Sphingomonadales bacterium]|nr:hypothetical protein [Sphingomonadales bacterium]
MSDDAVFEEINEAKTNLDGIYDQPDPREYFRKLKPLRYGIPDAAKPIFQRLISHLRRRRSETVHVLDLGCSYGVNAALLKHDLSMPELYEHWGQEKFTEATPDEVVEYDRRYFGTLPEAEDIEVIGLDQAEQAVEFAEEVGLIDEGLAVNLETEQLPGPVKENLAQVDLITSTGCVGYVTEKTFERLLPAVTDGNPPWLANFVLRMFPFEPISEMLKKRGYATEKLEGHTFVQRNFTSEEERKQVLQQLHEQGIDPAGEEAEGHLLAEFYLSRPIRDSVATPIGQLALA